MSPFGLGINLRLILPTCTAEVPSDTVRHWFRTTQSTKDDPGRPWETAELRLVLPVRSRSFIHPIFATPNPRQFRTFESSPCRKLFHPAGRSYLHDYLRPVIHLETVGNPTLAESKYAGSTIEFASIIYEYRAQIRTHNGAATSHSLHTFELKVPFNNPPGYAPHPIQIPANDTDKLDSQHSRPNSIQRNNSSCTIPLQLPRNPNMMPSAAMSLTLSLLSLAIAAPAPVTEYTSMRGAHDGTYSICGGQRGGGMMAEQWSASNIPQQAQRQPRVRIRRFWVLLSGILCLALQYRSRQCIPL